MAHWCHAWLQRIVFNNTLSHKEAVERVKSDDGRVDLVTDLSPLETLRVAQSPAAQVVKKRRSATTVFGFFNIRKAGSPWHDVRLRQAVNYAIHREDLIRYATKGNGMIIPALVPEQGFGPRGPGDVALGHGALSCRPCSAHGQRVCPLLHHRCMKELAVETVAAALAGIKDVVDRRAICPGH